MATIKPDILVRYPLAMQFRFFSLSLAALAGAAWAQQPSQPPAPAAENANQNILKAEGYVRPSAIVEQAVLAPWHLNASVGNLNPAQTHWVQLTRDGLPKLADLGRPHLNLAGLEIDLGAECDRSLISRRNSGMVIRSLGGDKPVKVDVPSGVSPDRATWSPDGKWIAFLGVKSEGVWLYVADAATGKVRRLSQRQLLATLESDLQWKADSSAVAVVLTPEKRPDAPSVHAVAQGPHVKVSDTIQNRIRTYADRLENVNEAKILKRLTTGQAALIDLKGGVQTVGEPKMIANLNAAPDFSAFRISEVREPFSMLFPFGSFSRREALVGANGKEIAELSRTPQPGSTPPSPQTTTAPGPRGPRGGGGAAGGQGAPAPMDLGRRGLTWAPDGVGIIYQQRGEADSEGKRKDRLIRWKAPYDAKSVEVLWETETEIGSFTWMPDYKSILITGSASGETTLSLVELAKDAKPKKLFGYKPGDFYTPYGTLVTKETPFGGRVARASEGSLFFSGVQYDKDPDKQSPRPFIDKVKMADGTKERVWQSAAELYETARQLTDDTLLVSRQSLKLVPNDYVVNLATKQERQVTQNVDRFAPGQGLQRKRVQITRADGFKYWAEVTLPKYAIDGVGRKAFFWFYPSEVRDQASFSERGRTRNINTYQRLTAGDPEILCLLGYVVVQPEVPIVGTAERPNDTYLLQLRNSLAATVDELSAQRLIDRRYLAIGGHSYGAFSTAHAMIQTPFFKAGIAGAGNYNRLLTPFGFQAEPRQLWEQKDIYQDLSAILRANELTGALLMYHGSQDQNIGTNPINSYRMFDALEALGKTASLYVYPYEDHGQIAQESRLDMWARWIAWLEEHVK